MVMGKKITHYDLTERFWKKKNDFDNKIKITKAKNFGRKYFGELWI